MHKKIQIKSKKKSLTLILFRTITDNFILYVVIWSNHIIHY